MCGIAGYLDAQLPRHDSVIERQLAELQHRGPDAKGWFGSHGGVIGQARLSIIDLVGGKPPITNEDGTIGASCSTARSTTSASCGSSWSSEVTLRLRRATRR